MPGSERGEVQTDLALSTGRARCLSSRFLHRNSAAKETRRRTPLAGCTARNQIQSHPQSHRCTAAGSAARNTACRAAAAAAAAGVEMLVNIAVASVTDHCTATSCALAYDRSSCDHRGCAAKGVQVMLPFGAIVGEPSTRCVKFCHGTELGGSAATNSGRGSYHPTTRSGDAREVTVANISKLASSRNVLSFSF